MRERFYISLGEVIFECSQPNWDGYEANPITKASVDNLIKFMNILDDSLPDPDPGCDPDGQVSIEWYFQPGRISLSFDHEEEKVYYAYILEEDKGCGTLSLEDMAQFVKGMLDGLEHDEIL